MTSAADADVDFEETLVVIPRKVPAPPTALAYLLWNRWEGGAAVLAYDFPLLSMFWVLMMWFFMFAIFFAVVWAFIDNFRRHDHSGWAKAGWALLILIIPLFGMLIYIIARPSDLVAPA